NLQNNNLTGLIPNALLQKSSEGVLSLRHNRGWYYHKDNHFWFIRVPNMEPLVRMNTYERGSYHCFDPNTFETVRK
ncbi:hypothetical protein S245_007963, partial [Arachis hypogaea]